MRVAIGAALVLGVASVAGLASHEARGQAASPSVRAAARLKYNPPPDWVRHYLPDDRYKLKGGTWKVVSTETDTFYYPAWAPEMLRQSPNIVIGFPSAAAAEEAGYKRSKYPMDSPLLGLTGRPLPTPPASAAPSGSPLGGLSLPTGPADLNRGKARRIVLSDGVSSTVLPPGWSYARHSEPIPQARGLEQKMDFFFPGVPDPNVVRNPRNVRFIVIGSVSNLPYNAQQVFSTSGLGRLQRLVEAGGRVNSQFSQLGRVRAAAFGNIAGISLPIPIPEFGRAVPVALGGRGTKAFFMIDTSRNAKGGRQIISGFRGR